MIKKNLLIIILSLTQTSGLVARDKINFIEYKQDCDSAYRLAIYHDKFKESIAWLKEVEKEYDTMFAEEYVLMAYCYKSLGKVTKSAKLLRTAWSHYAFDLNALMYIDEIQPALIMKGYNKRQKRMVNQGFENFGKLKTDLTDSLAALFNFLSERDQRPRLDSNLYDSIPIVDSLNLLKFKEIVYKYGYPGENLLPGVSAVTTLLLTHSTAYPEFMAEMQPVFLNEVKAGHMPPSFYLFWLDRHNEIFNLPKHYGMLDLKEVRNMAEEQKQLVIKRRIEYGLVAPFPIPSTMVSFKE